jgi:hypothetical protein
VSFCPSDLGGGEGEREGMGVGAAFKLEKQIKKENTDTIMVK